jgi:PAT family beta-lactamase induction signal transducer AmpG
MKNNGFKPWYYYTLFGLLYFVQGSALAYFRNFQKPYLDSVSIDAGSIGLLTAILLVPFVLKILIGMLSDKVSLFGLGYRKPYILTGLILAAIAFLLASRIMPDKNFLLFSTFIVLGSFSVALFDSCTDGYAIEITPKQHYGRVQSIMVSGRAFGFIILSLLFGYLVQRSSYSIIFIIVGLVMMIPFIFALFAREKPSDRIENQFEWKAFRLLLKPVFLVFALYTIFYSFASFGVDGLITYYMSNSLHAMEESIGHYGALRGTGAAIGAIIGGLLLTRIGYKRMAYITIIVLSSVAILIGLSTRISMIISFAVLWGFAWGLQECVFLSLAMALADVRIAASMFAIMMAISNLGTAIVEGVATALSVQIGFQKVFIFLAIFNFINLAILYLYFRIWKPVT